MVLTISCVQAEEIKVYPQGVSEAQIKKHGRARTRTRIHQITRSAIFSKGLTHAEQEAVRKKAMSSPKHNWSTTEREKKHKKILNKDVRCNTGLGNEDKKLLPKHKINKSNPSMNSMKCKTKF